MSMSRKDYVAIAAELKGCRASNQIGNRDKAMWNRALDAAARRIADVMASNPEFQRQRFLDACDVGTGIDSNGIAA